MSAPMFIGAPTEPVPSSAAEMAEGEADGRQDRAIGFKVSESTLALLYTRAYADAYRRGWATEPADADATELGVGA